jgi:phosphoglycerate dehydrogenase-like enzyme
MRIVLCYPLQQRHLDQIQAAAPDAELVNAGQERIAEEILAADVFCGHPKVPTPWNEVVQLNRLKWLQSSAAGTDHLQSPSMIESPIIITNISGVLANQVSEQALALLLGLIRGLPTFFRAQQAKEYIRRPVRDLHGSTIGIAGLGGVGRRVAELLSAFKTRILATDLYPIDKPPHVEALWPADRLDDLLPLVDILVLCVPLTQETRGMIDARRLALMRRGSILINVARGPVVVEHDLVTALESGQLWGAGVDVAATEPLPIESRLWEMPNVIITPHVGGESALRADQITDFFCENLRRYLAGKPLLNLIDKRLGFPIRKAANAK